MGNIQEHDHVERDLQSPLINSLRLTQLSRGVRRRPVGRQQRGRPRGPHGRDPHAHVARVAVDAPAHVVVVVGGLESVVSTVHPAGAGAGAAAGAAVPAYGARSASPRPPRRLDRYDAPPPLWKFHPGLEREKTENWRRVSKMKKFRVWRSSFVAVSALLFLSFNLLYFVRDKGREKSSLDFPPLSRSLMVAINSVSCVRVAFLFALDRQSRQRDKQFCQILPKSITAN